MSLFDKLKDKLYSAEYLDGKFKGLKDDVNTLYKDTSRNKYRIEEVDIRLANLELTCKEFFDKVAEIKD